MLIMSRKSIWKGYKREKGIVNKLYEEIVKNVNYN